jgi:hypothetical protein
MVQAGWIGMFFEHCIESRYGTPLYFGTDVRPDSRPNWRAGAEDKRSLIAYDH